MQWVDLAIVGVVLLSTVFSIIRGFVREAISLTGWVMAIWLAITFEPDVQLHLDSFIEQEYIRRMMAFFALFLGTLLVFGLLGYLVGKFLMKAGLSGTDRMLGMIFGFARGLLIVLIPVIVAMRFGLADDPGWRDSMILPHMEALAIWLSEVLPPGMAEYIQPATH